MEHNELTVVMELANHGDLSNLLRAAVNSGRRLPEARVWQLFAQIAGALAYMHERRVMHRDIKPANVFISSGEDNSQAQSPVLKLGDLGLGRYFSSKTDMTHSTVGTPYYMSPECIRGGGYDFKSDVWSLGCLLYELAALRSPFYAPALNFYVLGKRIVSRQFEPLDLVSDALVQSVDRMLQVDSADRLSAAEVLSLAERGEGAAEGNDYGTELPMNAGLRVFPPTNDGARG